MAVISQKNLDEMLTDEGLAALKEEARKSVTPEWWERYGEEAWKTGLIVFGITSPRDDANSPDYVTMNLKK